MRRIAIASQKGGAGKTTTAVSLAAALGERQKRVLVVDLDPQLSASSYLGHPEGARGLFDVFTDEESPPALEDLVVETAAPGVDLVPASELLARTEAALAGDPTAAAIFPTAVEALDSRWDFLLVDCPPSLGILSVSALAACQEVLVPVEAQAMALDGLARLARTVERVREGLRRPDLRISAILATRYRSQTNLAREVLETLQDRFPRETLSSFIREDTRLGEAPSHRLPITLYAPRSRAAEDYRAAAQELLRRRPRERKT